MPIKPIEGKVSIPDMLSLEKMQPKKASELRATEISY
jgi:hypothetical protein